MTSNYTVGQCCGKQGFDVVHTQTCDTGGRFELVGLDKDGLCGADYLGIDLFGIFYSEEVGKAGTVSRHEGDDDV
jgi:hypothetical protein